MFTRAMFLGDTYLNKVNNIRTQHIIGNAIRLDTERKRQGQLLFYGVSFLGRVYLIESQLDILDFSERGPTYDKEKYELPPTIFQKQVIARDLNCGLQPSRFEFRDVADFSGSRSHSS